MPLSSALLSGRAHDFKPVAVMSMICLPLSFFLRYRRRRAAFAHHYYFGDY